jgi:broad specificity phosphatase PhoE
MSSKVASSSRLAFSRFFLGGCSSSGGGANTIRSLSSVANQASLKEAIVQPTTRQHQLLSTLQQPVEDFDDYDSDDHVRALAEAIGMLAEHDKKRREERTSATAYEIIPFHSKSAKELSSMLTSDKPIDKVVICIRHGESEHNVFERDLILQGKNLEDEMLHNEDYPRDPILTKRGFGQALNIARKVADCCNRDTKLMPELVVVSPLKRATITALLSFPQNSPLSVRNTKWICHPALMEMGKARNPADKVSPMEELSSMFPGIDYSLLREQQDADEKNYSMQINNARALSEAESKLDLLARADSFLDWIRNREERVIVVASHSAWLQTFCGFSMAYEPKEYGKESFQTGELRCLALTFQKR